MWAIRAPGTSRDDRWMRIDPTWLLVPALVLFMGAIAWDLASQSIADGEATAVPAEIFTSVHGVRVGITVDFPEDREVTGAAITLGERSHSASLYPLDGTDPDRPLAPLPITRGTGLLVEGTLVDVCRGDTGLPVLTVASTVAGDHRTDRYTLEDDAAYGDAVSQWCGRGVQVLASG